MIRPATPADADALARLQSHLPSPSPELLQYALSTGDVLVADVDGTPVGYVLCVPDDGGSEIHVAELVVSPAHRRNGHATALLTAVTQSADRVTLAVAPDNARAIECYRSCGFECAEKLPDLFEDGDALLFAWD